MKGSLDKESFARIKAGDRKARLQEELIGDRESKEVELVLLGDMELLFLAKGQALEPQHLSWVAASESLHCPPHRAICREGG